MLVQEKLQVLIGDAIKGYETTQTIFEKISERDFIDACVHLNRPTGLFDRLLAYNEYKMFSHLIDVMAPERPGNVSEIIYEKALLSAILHKKEEFVARLINKADINLILTHCYGDGPRLDPTCIQVLKFRQLDPSFFLMPRSPNQHPKTSAIFLEMDLECMKAFMMHPNLDDSFFNEAELRPLSSRDYDVDLNYKGEELRLFMIRGQFEIFSEVFNAITSPNGTKDRERLSIPTKQASLYLLAVKSCGINTHKKDLFLPPLKKDIQRFFYLIDPLPLEIKMLLCNFAFDDARDMIPPKSIKCALDYYQTYQTLYFGPR